MRLSIPVILGTARQGRYSEKAAEFMFNEVRKLAEVDSEMVDIRDFLTGVTDSTGTSDQARRFAEKVTKADGLIIVAPEYNHSYPGELKITLDMLSKEYTHKPVGICGVSSGMLGGARAVEQLRLVAIELRMAPIREAVYFSRVRDLFDENGEIKDESYRPRIEKFFAELLWYARALKVARES